MTDHNVPRPVGAVMGDYVWDGRNWVPRTDGAGNTFDGVRWHSRAQHHDEAQFPAMTTAFADPRYAFGLTKRTADDLQFIARYMKVMIVIGLIAAGLYGLFMVVILGGLAALMGR